ncbi:MAG: dehydrogenase [Anaeroplasmataceae bacterium]
MKVRAKAPLRIGLAGGGTDLSPFCDIHGGLVLNATINLYAHCTIERLNNERIIFEALDISESIEFDLNSKPLLSDSLRLHIGVYNRIVKDYNNNEDVFVKITTFSDAPPGSGLGSSSTMVVVMIKAFVELLKLPLGEYDIAQLAFDIERNDLNLSGGKQDQYAATFGGFNLMEFYANNRVIVNPLRIRNWFINELEESMLLYFTGVSRESAKIIDEQISSTTKNRDNNLDSMIALKSSTNVMKEALLKGDIKLLAQELNKGWDAKKKTSNSISNSHIDDIFETAINAGAYAGKISGAGGGGFMMFIIDPLKKLAIIKALSKFDGKIVEFQFVEKGTKSWYLES